MCPQTGDDVILVDFSYSADIIEAWIRDGVRVQMLDHHATARQNFERFYVEAFQDSLSAEAHRDWNVCFDMEECGATLAWQYFHRNLPMPAFLEFVRSRDLWLDCDLFKDPIPETLIAHEALSGFRSSLKRWAGEDRIDYRALLFQAFDELAELPRDEYLELATHLALDELQKKRRKCQEIAARWRWRLFENPILDPRYSSPGDWCQPCNIPVVELAPNGSEDRYTSDVCMILYRQFPDALFVACITSDGTWSLCSDKDGNNTDVGAIAKALGGGGHRNAAGFNFSPSPKNTI